MRANKYKIFAIVLLITCSIIVLFYLNIDTKIEQALMEQETAVVSTNHKQKFTVYDALATIDKQKSLEVVKINIDEKNSCSIEIIYKGKLDNFLEILDDLSKEVEVNNISNISISSNGSAVFSVNFILNK